MTSDIEELRDAMYQDLLWKAGFVTHRAQMEEDILWLRTMAALDSKRQSCVKTKQGIDAWYLNGLQCLMKWTRH